MKVIGAHIRRRPTVGLLWNTQRHKIQDLVKGMGGGNIFGLRTSYDLKGLVWEEVIQLKFQIFWHFYIL